jgi:hypothetical protein
LGDDEEKGEYDTRINKARPVGNIHGSRDLEDDSSKIRKSHDKKDK